MLRNKKVYAKITGKALALDHLAQPVRLVRQAHTGLQVRTPSYPWHVPDLR